MGDCSHKFPYTTVGFWSSDAQMLSAVAHRSLVFLHGNFGLGHPKPSRNRPDTSRLRNRPETAPKSKKIKEKPKKIEESQRKSKDLEENQRKPKKIKEKQRQLKKNREK